MKRFVSIAAAFLLVAIASMGFSESDEAQDAASIPSGKQPVSTTIAAAACGSSCAKENAPTNTDASCSDCSQSTNQCSQRACTECCKSSAAGFESRQQCFEDACVVENSDETLVGHGPPWARSQNVVGQGPPWARGQNAGQGMQGRGRGQGQGHGQGQGQGHGQRMGQAQMGCGMVLREAINHGKIDQQLVQSLLFGPQGSAKQGKQVFVKNCSVCHKLRGQGADIAPDLTNRPRHNPIYLLANLSHPSAVIPNEYQVHVVVTDTGKVVTGLKINENPKAITILDAANRRTVIRRDKIEDLQLSEKSLMPENLIESLGEAQLRDLFQYLRS